MPYSSFLICTPLTIADFFILLGMYKQLRSEKWHHLQWLNIDTETGDDPADESLYVVR